MRKITKESLNAFLNGENFQKSNMQIKVDGCGATMLLFGHEIAKRQNGKLWIRTAGWETNTTKERLNSLDGVSIHQSNFVWYLNGEKWEKSWNWKKIK